jgi:hypothetical protein
MRNDAESSGWLDRTHLTLIIALVGGVAALLGFQMWLAGSGGRAERGAANVDLAQFSVYLHRKGCATGCPVYAVLADGKGTLRFEGVSGVSERRSVETPLDTTTARALAAAVLRADFMAQPDAWVPGGAHCQAYVQGAEILQFGVTLDGVTRTLDYYGGCTPTNAALDLLAREIDAVLGTERWVGAVPR